MSVWGGGGGGGGWGGGGGEWKAVNSLFCFHSEERSILKTRIGSPF